MKLYKIVRVSGEFRVIPAEQLLSFGTEIRPYGSHQDCMARAEKKANASARKASGGRKGRHTVVRNGDTFRVVRVE